MTAGRYIVGRSNAAGYSVRQWSTQSFTVEHRGEFNGLWRDRLLGSYSTKAQAIDGLERMKTEGIRQ